LKSAVLHLLLVLNKDLFSSKKERIDIQRTKVLYYKQYVLKLVRNDIARAFIYLGLLFISWKTQVLGLKKMCFLCFEEFEEVQR